MSEYFISPMGDEMSLRQKDTEKWGHFRDKPDYAPLKLWKNSLKEYQSLCYIGGKLEMVANRAWWVILVDKKMVHSGGSLEYKNDTGKQKSGGVSLMKFQKLRGTLIRNLNGCYPWEFGPKICFDSTLVLRTYIKQSLKTIN